MRKSISFMLALTLIAGLLTACGSDKAQESSEEESVQIVTTIAPEYDWVMNILGDNPAGAEVTLLLDSGVDIHSYQPTADDMLLISNCDLFIYVGGESDDWVDGALKSAANQDIRTLNLLEALGHEAKEEEIVEGMEGEEEEEGGEEEEGPEYDEHVWLSLRNASVLCGMIAEALSEIDSDHADLYMRNTEAYQDKLSDLDGQYAQAVEQASTDTLLFGDRFPFRYMTDDYGLQYYAAFVGCSAETEASFETITFLAEKTDELGLRHICVIEGAEHKLAKTIIDNTKSKDQKIVTFDSMQSMTSKDFAGGATYLSAMESNLTALIEALQ